MSSRTGHEKGRRTSQSKTGHFKRSGKPNRVEDQTTRRHPTRTAKAKAKA
ncbi:23S rRNA pseudouridylate synthase, partial [Vibrio parahaemolyticus]